MSSAGWPAALIALPIASMSFTTPDAVSICATRIALMLVILVLPQPRLDLVGPHGAAQVALQHLDLGAHAAAASPQPIAKRPLSSTSTLSPRDSTLVSAASQAPWPLAM